MTPPASPSPRPHASPDGTVTILLSDIEGSTAITDRLGDWRWLELLSDLRPAHIQAAYGTALAGGRADGRSGGLSARSVLQHHRELREALSHAVRWQLLVRNPAEAVTPPQAQRHEMHVLTREEARRLLEIAEGGWRVLIYLALATGARLGELLALR